MPKTVLVTGGVGLIGSAVCQHFVQKGWNVLSVDNDTRGKIFGPDGSTAVNKNEDDYFKSVEDHAGDIRDAALMEKLVKRADAVAHVAAQPSHPRSLEIPMEDFQINAFGTLQLLELVRTHNPEIPLAFTSSNKVYGDYPNYFNYKVVERRYENTAMDAFDESLPIDHCGHTPFGVSKVAADLYCQEYAINYGLKTATFRGGCLTGKNSRAVEMHGYLPYIVKCALTGQPYTVYGGGYRVRDQIHASDVASALYAFIQKPKPRPTGEYGQAYNLGGERENSISIFETIDAVKEKTGKELKYTEGPDRESDHIWWISDMGKFKKHYPAWKREKSLDDIFNEIIAYYNEKHGLHLTDAQPQYFRKQRG